MHMNNLIGPLDKILNEFSYFGRLHTLMLTCPNVTPIVTTTEVRPNGPISVLVQNLSDNENLSSHSTSPHLSTSQASAPPVTSEASTATAKPAASSTKKE